jgi:hypothetical protein
LLRVVQSIADYFGSQIKMTASKRTREGDVGGLLPPKVLKNVTNHMFLV